MICACRCACIKQHVPLTSCSEKMEKSAHGKDGKDCSQTESSGLPILHSHDQAGVSMRVHHTQLIYKYKWSRVVVSSSIASIQRYTQVQDGEERTTTRHHQGWVVAITNPSAPTTLLLGPRSNSTRFFDQHAFRIPSTRQRTHTRNPRRSIN